MIRATFYSVVPSPYQRDLFYALSQHPEINLNIFYLESACTDSPWPEQPLQPYEHILPGFHFAWGLSRFHINWHLPKISQSDVVVLNGYMSVTAQMLLRLQAEQIPCVFWGEKMLGTSGGLKGKLQQTLAGGLSQCQAIAAIGSQAVQAYQQRFPGKPIFNIPYYCDLSAFSYDIPQRPRTPPTILFCGQIIARKGVDLLLQAFDRLIQMGLEARLLLVGREADLPQILATVSEKTRRNIEYAGFQAPEDLPYFFRQADLFVLPSRYDGWGVVVNQAIGAGLPVICSNAVGAAYDLIDQGKNGYVFPNGDVDTLTQVLANYFQNPMLIQMASSASIEKVGAWTPEAGAQLWVNAFHELVRPIHQFTLA
ncbi:MAG: glycosyltransferase family 4 protein [Aulosira sp. ZfuVER01]|nr:glycosyltransferase family 4 protein [Aulosira sp. ZfuVER01]MDZ7997756.1 glycosyltransferase family 4 protein [Aulosira sp. DedVER01a]MDZ8052251.1 glycosyltransferase family 4 protein [Aulosira sp. ZfuCHP01]